MNINDVQLYLDLWLKFKFCCEHRAKLANCHINNKGWQKLKEYHLENFLKTNDNPYGFLFKIKHRHPNIYRQVQCMPRFYYRYLKKKELDFEMPSRLKSNMTIGDL